MTPAAPILLTPGPLTTSLRTRQASHPWLGLAQGVDIAQLDQVIMVLREPSSITRRTFDQACDRAGVNPRVLLELDSREAAQVLEVAVLAVDVLDITVADGHGSGRQDRDAVGFHLRHERLAATGVFRFRDMNHGQMGFLA